MSTEKDDHVEELKRVAQVMMKYENVKDEGFLCRMVACFVFRIY